MPFISYSRVRESDAMMRQNLLDAVLRSKARLLVKLAEAQTIPVELTINPDPPVEPNAKFVLEQLISQGPLDASQVATLMQLNEVAVLQHLESLVNSGKATKSISPNLKIIYRAKQQIVKRDSPYKGKRIRWAPTHTFSSRIREDGQEEVTCTLEYTLEDIPL